MKLSSRPVAHVVEVVVHESVSCHANRRQAEVWTVLVVSMIVWVVVVDWSLSLVAAIAPVRAIEFALVSLPRIS